MCPPRFSTLLRFDGFLDLSKALRGNEEIFYSNLMGRKKLSHASLRDIESESVFAWDLYPLWDREGIIPHSP